MLLSRSWSQNTFSSVARATLLRAFKSHVAEIGGITRYWVGGDGPPLVLVHGLAGAAYNFTERALPRAAASRSDPRPARPRGTGALPVVESLGDLAAHVVRVAEYEDMTPPAVLGYSMGGVVALRAAAERPDRVLSCSSHPPGSSRQAGGLELWLGVTGLLRPARRAARAQARSRRPGLRAVVFGLGRRGPRRLSLPRRCTASSTRSTSTRT